MRIIVIINPTAGASRQRQEIRHVIAQLRRDGMTVDVQHTHYAGHGETLARTAASQRYDAVVGVGGDGTIRELTDALAGTDVPLVICPTGTENLVAKSMGFSRNADCIRTCLREGHTVHIDVGRANGRSFLIVAGFGFDAEVVHRLTAHRTGHITHLSYFGPIWRTFWEHRFPRMAVRLDDGFAWEGRGLVFVGNLPRYALGLPVVRDANGEDGLLDLCIMPCQHQITLLGHSLRTAFGRHVEHAGVIYRRFRRGHVEALQPVALELDGEAAGSSPVQFEVTPGAVTMLVPPRPSRC